MKGAGLAHALSGILLILAPCLLACGGGATASENDPGSPSASLSVAVQPASQTLAPGSTFPFSAIVKGGSGAVTWSVMEGTDGGTISPDGTYTAPALAGLFTVRAALSQDPGRFGEARVTVGAGGTGACAGAELGPNASLGAYLPFPADNPWNLDVSAMPVDADSSHIIAFIGATAGLKADFGSGLWEGAPIGIPYLVVPGTQPRVPVRFTAYGAESDPGPMPLPASAPIEGSAASEGDRHVLVMDRDTCTLYELYRAFPQADGSWNADSASVWDLRSNVIRPFGWTSADAAGLPIFPGLARYDEVASGEVRHALRFTVPTTRKAYVLPATHWASGNASSSAPPMGMRVRLKSAVDLSGYPAQAQVLLRALKKYGMILADNGSAWFLSGAPDERWDNEQLRTLGNIKGTDLEVVKMDRVYASHPVGAAPAISEFRASASTVTAGQSVSLSWSATNATRCFISPMPGLVQGGTVSLRPLATTTYTLLVQGPYGSATQAITVPVASPAKATSQALRSTCQGRPSP